MASEGGQIYNPAEKVAKISHCSSMEQYKQMYEKSIKEPEAFWGDIAKDFYFEQGVTGKFVDYNFDTTNGKIFTRWLAGAKTNICYNCLDRHVSAGKGDQVAFYWVGNDPADAEEVTYADLLKEVCRLANYLKAKGVAKGDRVAIYMPMIKELVVAMLAVARIGAVHSIVFGGYSAESLSDRMLDAEASVLITADAVWRGAKLIHLKDIADDALKICKEKNQNVKLNLVVQHMKNVTAPQSVTNGAANGNPAKKTHFDDKGDYKVTWNPEVDVWWHEALSDMSAECPPVWMDTEDPLFMLYTSGSTGKPKGVLHTIGGYMLYSATTFKYTFDYHPNDVYFCTADIGWITGHSYVTYGPLLNNATSVLFEGVPTYPHTGRFWEIIEKYKVSKFYTAPTAIRTLMKFGDDPVKKYDLSSLSVLGSVGEPINPEAWLWYYKVVGDSNVSIVDTFWQTETGGHVVTPLPGATPCKPGSACFPFFGVDVALLDEEGVEIKGEGEGYLVFRRPWPGIMRTVYGNHERFETTYFKKFPGFYCTGDGARRDKDGYIWVTGRIDDMLNVSGHLLSTAQVESAMVEHPSVAESAVVARPHAVKGECLYCFVTLAEGSDFTDKLIAELKNKVRGRIGPFATPDFIQLAPGLPKTRSGKIMRRVLRKIAVGDRDFGDISTLADPSIVDVLFQHRPKEGKV
ncbi:acetyl-coenzyme A synthetase, cytoplasmic-like isoform X1 [Penaeus japonicus]|uniref:acetyl-coenzyme A synthetase, cytoplasmic-like isoform X1 n=1 Tax=Penaeus japonicus TaxID=27405 RepID=UPI001C713442|nr:acetyl-coenzyme A synthetase, cytoplasmic-like isoform X1 [Penaeus japonicus]